MIVFEVSIVSVLDRQTDTYNGGLVMRRFIIF